VLLLRRTRPPVAAVAALAAGVALLTVFPASARALLDAGLLAAGTGAEVAAIILGGLWLDELLRRSGARDRLADWLAAVTADPGLRVLLVVLGVVPFAESVTGFGVGAIVGVPLLLGMGFAPGRAAVLALLGFVAVPWGALAPGTLIASRLTGVGFTELGVRSALLSLPVIAVCGLAALVVGTGWGTAGRRAGALGLTGGALWLGILGANRVLGTPLAGALGALAAIGVVLLLARRAQGRLPAARPVLAAWPYGLLLALLLLGQAGAAGLTGGPVAVVLGSAATWLLVTCLVTARGSGLAALTASLPRWRPVALTTAAFLALGALMAASGMAAALAGAGALAGDAYAGLAPWLGGVGGFLTGSNAGANALFATAQAEAARQAGLPVIDIVALQNVGASLATMASAARIQLTLSLLGPHGRDQGIARPVLAIDAVALAALSAAGLLLAR
jgi:lactate permease